MILSCFSERTEMMTTVGRRTDQSLAGCLSPSLTLRTQILLKLFRCRKEDIEPLTIPFAVWRIMFPTLTWSVLIIRTQIMLIKEHTPTFYDKMPSSICYTDTDRVVMQMPFQLFNVFSSYWFRYGNCKIVTADCRTCFAIHEGCLPRLNGFYADIFSHS